METKACRRCQVEKPRTEYPEHNGRIHGARCLACLAELRRLERAARPPKPAPPRDRDRTEKTCSACGMTKPVSAFYWNQRKWKPRCRSCILERQTAKRRANLEEARAKDREVERRLKPKRLAKGRAYYAANRDRICERERSTWPQRAPQAKESARLWRAKNPHRITEINLRRRARLVGAPVIEDIDRAAIIARDNSTCYLCDMLVSGRSLTLDHLTPLVRGGEHTAANLRVACRSCNSKKGHLTVPEYLARLQRAATEVTRVARHQNPQVAS